MRTLLLVTLLSIGFAALTGCSRTFGGEDTFGKQGPYYGEKPAYFDEPQPGLGGRVSDR
jgi:hypothetical protein